ncbi:MAG: hypothetical protein JO029_10395 [Candidatus Eremiobacteraeota bacterium]|nr:hypothetical protein [Candidatus Eremiobacteraeota bacterium]
MRTRFFIAGAAAVALTACTALGTGRSIPFAGSGIPEGGFLSPDAGATSVLKTLKKHLVIGSTVDPLNGDQNPYGLTIVPKTGGKLKAGDLLVCNFNAKSNVQGTGTTIVSLAPTPGSKPQRFVQSSSLLGCAALAETQSGKTLAASFGAKPATAWWNTAKPAGTFSKGLARPWGIAYAVASGIYTYASDALFVSDASTGSIVLAASCIGGLGGSSCTYAGTPIVTGFGVNHGKPGSILGPSGLLFDPTDCVKIQGRRACGTLYVADGQTNTIVAIHNALNLRKAKSIVVSKSGTTFSGPEGTWASLVYAGKPLNGPISLARFYNGNLVAGNTLDPKGKNLMIEIAPPACAAVPCPLGKYVYTLNVDKGFAGAIFGMVSTGSGAKAKLYFNDDNTNSLDVLEP